MEGCTCQKCGKIFEIDTTVSDAIWEKIKPVGKPQGGGLLCPICVMEELIKAIRKSKGLKLDLIKIELLCDGTPVDEEEITKFMVNK